MHENDFKGARQALEEFAGELPDIVRALFSALVDILESKNPEEVEKLLDEMEECSGIFTFYKGVLCHGAGRIDKAMELMTQFYEESEGNPREWGVTLRWEIAKAKEIVASLSSD